jgi:hypothetical protein
VTHLRDSTQPHVRPELERGILPRWLDTIPMHRQQADIRTQAIDQHGRSHPIVWDITPQDERLEHRCVPVMHRGVRAVIPGSDPVGALMAKQPPDPA